MNDQNDHGVRMNPMQNTTSSKMVGGDRYRLVVIAASAGRVESIGEVLSAFPADFPVPIDRARFTSLHPTCTCRWSRNR